MDPPQRKVKRRRGFSRKRVSCFQEESQFNRIGVCFCFYFFDTSGNFKTNFKLAESEVCWYKL